MSAEEIVRGRIEAIKARCEAATPGPWIEDGYGAMVWAENPYGRGRMHALDVRGWGHLTGTGACHFLEDKAVEITRANAAFSAHAREDIPYLLERIAELEGQLTEEISRRYQAECNYDHWKATCENERAQLAASQQETRVARNELCLKCGCYCESHKGACDGCRWKEI